MSNHSYNPKRSDEITPRQQRVLQTIQRLMDEWGFPPTLQEIGDELGMKPPSVYDFVRQLVRKGYVRHTRYKARSLELTDKPVEKVGGLIAIPIVGSIPAGMPVMAEENIIGELSVDRSVVRSGKHFALQVDGDSMIDADIQDKDFVIVRQQPVAENGEIVVALLNGEATLKRFKYYGELMELKPENPAYTSIPLRPDDDLRILGKVVAVRRKQSQS